MGDEFKMPIVLKIFIIALSVIALYLVISIISEWYYSHNYFTKNYSKFEQIKDMVLEKGVEGIFYIDLDKYEHKDKSKRYYDCFGKKSCEIFDEDEIDILNNLGIDLLICDDGELTIRSSKYRLTKKGESYIFILYKPGYFKGKEQFHRIEGNRYHQIIRIFNDDWGVLDYCHLC